MSGSSPLLPTMYTFMAWSGKTFPFITFDKFVNSICHYQSFHASAFRVKYPVKTGITFLHDNARPNNARLIRGAVQNYGLRGVLPHPSCPPDFIPSNHHVFGG
jgi:hypothetical protein